MVTFVLREPTIDDVKEDVVALSHAAGAIVSEIKARTKAARVRIRLWGIVFGFCVCAALAELYFQVGGAAWLVIWGWGLAAIVGMLEGMFVREALDRQLIYAENVLRSYGFDCEWSPADWEGKTWAKLDKKWRHLREVNE